MDLRRHVNASRIAILATATALELGRPPCACTARNPSQDGEKPSVITVFGPLLTLYSDMAYRVCLSQDCPDGAGKAKRDLQNMATEGK